MKKPLKLALLAGALMATVSAASYAAPEGPWMVRARAVNLNMENKSDPIVVGGTQILGSDQIEVNDKTIPEIDISYFFTKNLAAELILTYPQKQDVKVAGDKIGTFKHLPPTLTLQYHFLPDATFRPYVGAGINYTRIGSVKLQALGADLDLDDDSIGGALQVGFDVKLADNWFLNVDVKKIYIESDVKLKDGGAKISKVSLDPLAIGVGVGWRF